LASAILARFALNCQLFARDNYARASAIQRQTLAFTFASIETYPRSGRMYLPSVRQGLLFCWHSGRNVGSGRRAVSATRSRTGSRFEVGTWANRCRLRPGCGTAQQRSPDRREAALKALLL